MALYSLSLLTLLLYLLAVLTILLIQRKSLLQPAFRVGKKVSWWLSGLSLYMYYLAADQGQFLFGIISTQGMSGMWLVWSALLGTFVVPVVFAPLWQKLDFPTDNQFLLFRYPGQSGKILHLFRAVYVGVLVVSLALCFHVLGFSRILEVFFDLTPRQSLLLTGTVLSLFALKNVFDLKLKMDALHATLFFSGFAIILYGIWHAGNGWQGITQFFEKYPEKKALLPPSNDTSAWFSLMIFLGVQWWSCYLFDGGGPEMARFTAVKSKRHAVWAGLLPVAISFVLSFLMAGHICMMLGMSSTPKKGEIGYVQIVYETVPDALKGLVCLGFFGMFITTAESLLNWGASFLTIDAYKGYINPKVKEKSLRMASFGAMLLLSMLSVLFAWQIDNLQDLIKLTFSIAAGVAPVYLLRWVWFRINAWSQLSAMLSSGVFTLLYPLWHAHLPLSTFPMNEARVVVVTLLTSLVWITVTFITPNQSEVVRQKMEPLIESRGRFWNRFTLAIGLGLCLLLLVVGSWYALLNP